MRDEIYNFRLSEQALKDLSEQVGYIEYYLNHQKRVSQANQQLQLSLDIKNNIHYITIQGSLNTKTAQQFLNFINKLSFDSLKSIKIDCKHLISITSSGLKMLMMIIKKINIPITLVNVSANIYALMELSGLDQIMQIKT